MVFDCSANLAPNAVLSFNYIQFTLPYVFNFKLVLCRQKPMNHILAKRRVESPCERKAGERKKCLSNCHCQVTNLFPMGSGNLNPGCNLCRERAGNAAGLFIESCCCCSALLCKFARVSSMNRRLA